MQIKMMVSLGVIVVALLGSGCSLMQPKNPEQYSGRFVDSSGRTVIQCMQGSFVRKVTLPLQTTTGKHLAWGNGSVHGTHDPMNDLIEIEAEEIHVYTRLRTLHRKERISVIGAILGVQQAMAEWGCNA